MVVADAEESAEAEDRVRHAPARLLDHDALDRSYLLAVSSVHCGALYLVASNQISGLARFEGH
jgi:hypothetical protein